MMHRWVKSTLGHGEAMCERCRGTNRELAVLGRLNVCDAAPESWLIVSWEHNGFWAPGQYGYTKVLDSAGRYSRKVAAEIVERANIVRPADSPHEVMVLAPEALDEHPG